MTAVLFLIFNRKDTAERVFQAIREARPARLYVAADGPRRDRAGEVERCTETRQIIEGVDWPCQVSTLFRDENLGCKRAVSSAIDWFFGNEEEGIILEDDTVPLPSFFPFCREMLERYRSDDRVMMVAGSNLVSDRYASQRSYFFSNYPHIWGWATWRRAWRLYDVSFSEWPDAKRADSLSGLALTSVTRWRSSWYGFFDMVSQHKIDTWDVQWAYAIMKRHGFSVTPRTNLVHNIGFGNGATHTTSTPSYIEHLHTRDLAFPLDHPQEVKRDLRADRLDELFLAHTALRFQIKSILFRAVKFLALGLRSLLPSRRT